MSESPLDILKQTDALNQLGGFVPKMPEDTMSGLLQVGMGFLTGTAMQGASSSTPQTVVNQKRQQDFFNQVTSDVNSNDNRIPSILEKIGDVAEGEGSGENWKQAFQDLPDFLKNIFQTAFNQSP
ncbi:MAG: hypothetical protein EBY39_14430, partial [Flavobacteriia bacterium]|nr:hypothetical protein [Flavobacteriia bacterium]